MDTRGVRVRLLGGFSISLADGSITAQSFRRRSGANLVQFLALAPGRRRHRDQVLEALWPDVPPETAANRLYQAASYARKALGTAEAIVLRGETVAFLPDADVTVDVSVIEHADPVDPDSVAAALASWGGELLPDLQYEEWAMEARDAVRRRYLELLRSTGRWRTVLDVEPTDERAHLELMTQALELGDPADVLARFDAMEQILAETVGAGPGTAAVSVRDQARAKLAEAPLAAENLTGLRAVVVATVDQPSSRVAPVEQQGATDARLIVAESLGESGGTVLDPADHTIAAVFATAGGALAAAVRCLQATEDHDRIPRRHSPGIRIGVDIGEVERTNGSWSGQAVGRASAISGVASDKQILCTSVVAELAGEDFQADLRLVDLGLFRVPELPPVSLHRVVGEGIEDGDTAIRASRIAGRRIPDQVEDVIGRDRELELVMRELEQSRLVSVVGPGGVGKTHLATAVGSRLRDDFPGGVWLCQLGAVRDAQGTEEELLAAVGGRRHTDTSITESVVRTLGDRASLVVLDNCEHQLDSIRKLSAEILARCPEVRLLATSREPIGIRAESVAPLGPLERAAAIELFCSEARRKGAKVDREHPAVGRICDRLDDLPLALQLAASRARGLDLPDVETLLDDRLDAFEQHGDGQVRHQTLRAAIAWSVEALPPGPLDLLVDLSALADRFSLDAAVTVAGREGRTRGELLDDFDELVRRSLVMGPDRIGDQPSYRLLESVRLYARELATDRGSADRHLAYFLERVEAADTLWRDRPDDAGRRIKQDWDDIRLARGHAQTHRRVEQLARLLGGVSSFSAMRLQYEFLQWCEDAWADDLRGVITAAQARAMGGWSSLLSLRGELDRAIEIGRLAYDANPDDDVVLWAMGWNMVLYEADPSRWRHYFEDLIEDRTKTAGTWRAGALHLLTVAAVFEGRDTGVLIHQLEVLAANGAPYRANLKAGLGYHLLASDPLGSIRAFEEAMEITERHGLLFGLMSAHQGVVFAAPGAQEPSEALMTIRQTLRWFSESGIWTLATLAILVAGRSLRELGRVDISTTLMSAREAHGVTEPGFERRRESLRKANPEQFDTWWATGQSLDMPAAVALTIATIDSELNDPRDRR